LRFCGLIYVKPIKNTDPKLNSHYTVILGAEGVLGKALAREIARKKCNVVVISTTTMDLQRFAIGLQLKEDVQVEAVKLDLADQDSILAFSETIRNRYEVRALINNITCDWSVAHNKCISEIAREDFMTRFRGAVQFTLGILPQLKQHPASYIQHIIPFPFRKNQFSPEMQQSVSKMYSFARELNEELKDTGVSVSMVHPEPMKPIVPDADGFDGLSEELFSLTPRLIALKAVNGMLRGSRLIIPGFRNKVHFFLSRQATSWFRSTQEDLGSALQPYA
jgi:short-subunit dehydrogenase